MLPEQRAYIFVSLWYFPVVFCAQLILRKVQLLLVSITGHLLIPLICIFTGSPSVLIVHMFMLLTIIKCLFKCSCWEVTPALQTFLSLEQRIIISHISTLCEQNFMWHPGFQNDCSCWREPLKVRVLRLLESYTNNISVEKLGVPTKLGQLLNFSRKDFSF